MVSCCVGQDCGKVPKGDVAALLKPKLSAFDGIADAVEPLSFRAFIAHILGNSHLETEVRSLP